MEKTKVVSLVLNSVVHDARVLKQAETLASEGYDVTVVGIKDAKNTFDSKMHGDTLEIILVPWKHALHSFSSNIILLITGFLFVLSLALSYVSYDVLSEINYNNIIFPSLKDIINVVVSLTVFLVFLFAIKRFVLPHYKKQKNFMLNYGVIENVIGSKANSSVFDYFLTQLLEYVKEKRIANLIINKKPAILHCHDVHGITIAALVKKKIGCKVVFDAHEIYDEVAQGSVSQKKHNEKKQQIAENISDGFVTINDSIAQYYKNKYPKLPSAVIVKNAVKYQDKPMYDGRLHEAAGLPLDRNILLYQGGFAKKRGLFELIKVGKYLPENWSLVFMGWGSAQAELEAELKKEKDAFFEMRKTTNSRKKWTQNKAYMIKSVVDYYGSTNSGSVIEKREFNGEFESISENFGFTKKLDKDTYKKIIEEINSHNDLLTSLDKLAVKAENDLCNFDKVVFIDKAEQSELINWTCGATIGIIPYENVGLNHYFCTPNKLWEYPVAGLPMLVSPFPEMSAVVEENQIGWLLSDPINPRALAAFIGNLDSEQIKDKSNKSLDYIKKDNWEFYSTRLIELYSKLKG